MERIGIAASKIAKGNLHLYNFYVVLLTLLFSFLVYFLTGSAIVFALVLIALESSQRHFQYHYHHKATLLRE